MRFFYYSAIIYWIITVPFVISGIWSPYPGEFIIKALPSLVAAGLCLRYLSAPLKIPLVLACVIGSIGDLLLGYNREQLFLYGLIAFLIEHLCFTFGFFKVRKLSKKGIGFSGFAVIYGTTIAVLVLPRVDTTIMAVGVGVYIAAIALMTCMAGFVAKDRYGLVAIGGCLYMICDSLTAIDKFVTQLPHILFVIVSLYYTAVFLMVYITGYYYRKPRKTTTDTDNLAA